MAQPPKAKFLAQLAAAAKAAHDEGDGLSTMKFVELIDAVSGQRGVCLTMAPKSWLC